MRAGGEIDKKFLLPARCKQHDLGVVLNNGGVKDTVGTRHYMYILDMLLCMYLYMHVFLGVYAEGRMW
jgi:hypothetical protein